MRNAIEKQRLHRQFEDPVRQYWLANTASSFKYLHIIIVRRLKIECLSSNMWWNLENYPKHNPEYIGVRMCGASPTCASNLSRLEPWTWLTRLILLRQRSKNYTCFMLGKWALFQPGRLPRNLPPSKRREMSWRFLSRRSIHLKLHVNKVIEHSKTKLEVLPEPW